MLRLYRSALLPLTLALLPLAGCGSDATSPEQDELFDAASAFTEEEAVAGRDSSATRLRLLQVQFRTSTADLTDGSLATLDKFAEVFRNLPGARYEVEGHTDSAGSSSYNLTLSRNRANAVRDYLVDEVGGPAASITATGHGEERPIANNATREGRATNRRIEVVVHDPEGNGKYRITMAADDLYALADCDDFSGDESARMGDFYVRATLSRVSGGEETLLDDSGTSLVQLHDGEGTGLDVAATARVAGREDVLLRARVTLYENDSSYRDFEETMTVDLVWDEAARCWQSAAGGHCMSGAEGGMSDTLSHEGSRSGHRCAVELGWSVQVEAVDR